MPTYEYECDACHRVFEIRQRISEPPLTTCDVCGGTVRRLLSAAPFILKGGGWYVTDYPSESRKKAMASEKPPSAAADKADKPAAKADGAKSDGAKSDGAKSDGAKSDGGSSSSSGTASGASSSSAPTKSD